MKYYLSNRQLKELERGNELSIVIPAPWYTLDGQSEIKEWARDMLDLPDPDGWIKSVSTGEVTVNPTKRAGNEDSLQMIIGEIENRPEDREPKPFSIQITVIAMRISKFRRPKSRYPHQWPGRIDLA